MSFDIVYENALVFGLLLQILIICSICFFFLNTQIHSQLFGVHSLQMVVYDHKNQIDDQQCQYNDYHEKFYRLRHLRAYPDIYHYCRDDDRKDR